MLERSDRAIRQRLADDDLVLDVGAWARPFDRADWVLDLLPHEARGLYGYDRTTAVERFSAGTWVRRDICDREPWPFADRQFDFAICSHTLEDVRDPVWVCAELMRVARAGYVEVPSRLEEQSWGVHGPWVGWSHHHWLCETGEGRIEFVFKPGVIHGKQENFFNSDFRAGLTEEQRVCELWWEGGFEAVERIYTDGPSLDAYLADFVSEHRPAGNGGREGRRRGGLRRRAR